ncbi:hypothetical protein CB1_000145024 [Camelus ferus]|nr:hypothetical protein CB1_000145024 [Camelus ferus]
MAAHLLPICTLFLNLLSMAQGSRGPVVPNRPFTTVWNANTQWCLEKHGVDVDISVFDVVANPGQDFRGPNMTIFYSSQLGTYPYYTSAGEPVFGGLPQNASLDAHLVRTFQDILAAMPASDFSGLAVIDWEAWRPRWAFNWDTKEIYRQRSRSLVQRQHPYWPAPLVEAAAQDQFQGAAQAWMAGTLKLGQALRPHGLWGYYGFPDCYNYDFLNPNYTGQCPPSIRAQNDQLGWLWSQSRALYPSIYIPAAMEGTRKAQMYVRHRVSEAFRVAVGAGDPSLPVLPYVQIFYDMTNHFLPLEELEHSLGESAAQGAAGVVLWVSWENTRTKESCQAIKEYVDTTLGPFILNVTSGALLCSQALCSGHGRCVRRLSHPEALLNFNPTSFSIKPMPGGGQLTLRDPTYQVELILSTSPPQLTLGPACQPEVTLRSNLAKLTLDPARQPEETPAPNLAELTLEPVHCRPELLDACADLINEQWPRSRASRLHSLGQSSDAFPLCLMLLSPCPTPKAAPIVVGHARLSRVLDRPQSLLVETVVLHFYAHLGYQLGFHPWGMTMQLGPALVLGVALCLGCGQPQLQAPEHPFLVLWNVPSARCKARFGVHLPLEALGITANRGQHFHGQNITIFYKNQLGLYPYLGPRGTAHNGGIPQAVPLDRHLAQAANQIRHSLLPGFAGLAVLDWEEWCPLWAGNWGHRHAYQAVSWAWAQQVFPNLDPQEQLYKARTGFEQAARALMEDTLPPAHHQAFVRYRLEEAFRVAFTGHLHPLPVLAYARLTHRRSGRFLSQGELMQTIGVSAALGAAGVVLWGDLSFSSSEEECWHLHDYVVGTLGPYVINVTRAAMVCSHQRCHGHGRCAWQDPGQLEAFLHLQPDGSPGAWESFSCRCYWGWAGPTCQEPRPDLGPEEAT